MEPEIRSLTTRYSLITAVVSFVTQPVPGADELIVVPIHYYFSASLTRRRGQSLLNAPWVGLSKIIWGGAAVRLFANFTLGLVPVAGLFSNAVTAAALTEFLGSYLDEALDRPGTPAPVSVRHLKRSIQRSLEEWRAQRG
jgi:uncharacterized protein (DUF697 family)